VAEVVRGNEAIHRTRLANLQNCLCGQPHRSVHTSDQSTFAKWILNSLDSSNSGIETQGPAATIFCWGLQERYVVQAHFGLGRCQLQIVGAQVLIGGLTVDAGHMGRSMIC
jgi:hypothetical protein